MAASSPAAWPTECKCWRSVLQLGVSTTTPLPRPLGLRLALSSLGALQCTAPIARRRSRVLRRRPSESDRTHASAHLDGCASSPLPLPQERLLAPRKHERRRRLLLQATPSHQPLRQCRRRQPMSTSRRTCPGRVFIRPRPRWTRRWAMPVATSLAAVPAAVRRATTTKVAEDQSTWRRTCLVRAFIRPRLRWIRRRLSENLAPTATRGGSSSKEAAAARGRSLRPPSRRERVRWRASWRQCPRRARRARRPSLRRRARLAPLPGWALPCARSCGARGRRGRRSSWTLSSR